MTLQNSESGQRKLLQQFGAVDSNSHDLNHSNSHATVDGLVAPAHNHSPQRCSRVSRLMLFFIGAIFCVGITPGSIRSQTLTIRNSTSKSLVVKLKEVKSGEGDSYSCEDKWNLKPKGEASLKIGQIPVKSVSYLLASTLGTSSRICVWSEAKSGNKLLEIEPNQLPVVAKQKSNFRTWRFIDGRKLKAKYVHHLENSKGSVFVQLIKEDESTVSFKLDLLRANDRKFVEGIEDGTNPILWEIGSKFITPENLIGREITVVMVRKFAKGPRGREARTVDPDWVYGPILKGTVHRITEKDKPYTAPFFPVGINTFSIMDPSLVLDGQTTIFFPGYFNIKTKTGDVKNYHLSLKSKGEVPFGESSYMGAAIESVVVDEHVYIPSKGRNFELGKSVFWQRAIENKPVRVISKKNEKSIKTGRKLLGGAAAIGATVLALKKVESELGKSGVSRSSRSSNLGLVGIVSGHLLSKNGDPISGAVLEMPGDITTGFISQKRKTNSQGFFSFAVLPSGEGFDGHRIEYKGKRVWKGDGQNDSNIEIRLR